MQSSYECNETAFFRSFKVIFTALPPELVVNSDKFQQVPHEIIIIDFAVFQQETHLLSLLYIT